MRTSWSHLTAPFREAPFRVFFDPFGGDSLALNEAFHWVLKHDNRLLDSANLRHG
jgi:hypothetical protein